MRSALWAVWLLLANYGKIHTLTVFWDQSLSSTGCLFLSLANEMYVSAVSYVCGAREWSKSIELRLDSQRGGCSSRSCEMKWSNTVAGTVQRVQYSATRSEQQKMWWEDRNMKKCTPDVRRLTFWIKNWDLGCKGCVILSRACCPMLRQKLQHPAQFSDVASQFRCYTILDSTSLSILKV